MQPTERPHEQENGNGNTQQPQQSCTSHFGLLCFPIALQRVSVGRVPIAGGLAGRRSHRGVAAFAGNWPMQWVVLDDVLRALA